MTRRPCCSGSNTESTTCPEAPVQFPLPLPVPLPLAPSVPGGDALACWNRREVRIARYASAARESGALHRDDDSMLLLSARELRYVGQHRKPVRGLGLVAGPDLVVESVEHERQADTGEEAEKRSENAARHRIVESCTAARRDTDGGGAVRIRPHPEVVLARCAETQARVVLGLRDRHRLCALEVRESALRHTSGHHALELRVDGVVLVLRRVVLLLDRAGVARQWIDPELGEQRVGLSLQRRELLVEIVLRLVVPSLQLRVDVRQKLIREGVGEIGCAVGIGIGGRELDRVRGRVGQGDDLLGELAPGLRSPQGLGHRVRHVPGRCQDRDLFDVGEDLVVRGRR